MIKSLGAKELENSIFLEEAVAGEEMSGGTHRTRQPDNQQQSISEGKVEFMKHRKQESI